jgi:polyribonucleotide nucleotidyltransferase
MSPFPNTGSPSPPAPRQASPTAPSPSRHGETNVFVAATAATTMRPGQDFFPLTVDYREKYAAAGRFPGGYFKREGRPSEKEILTSRLCDRPCRPLFPEGFLNEVQIIGLLLSADQVHESDISMINGASAALAISDIPVERPDRRRRVGQVDGQFVVNPTIEQMFPPPSTSSTSATRRTC